MTGSIDYFYWAMDFRDAYKRLPDSGRPPEWPKYVLFYHAMELVLKADLIRRGVKEREFTEPGGFRHDIKRLLDAAVNRGLNLPLGSQEAIAAFGEQPPDQVAFPPHIRIRYPGGRTVYWLEEFDSHMEHLFTAVGAEFGIRL